eukprot:15455571-Alexandrium_andersonii.AAC.1
MPGGGVRCSRARATLAAGSYASRKAAELRTRLCGVCCSATEFPGQRTPKQGSLRNSAEPYTPTWLQFPTHGAGR